jgi:hypothetical protein
VKAPWRDWIWRTSSYAGREVAARYESHMKAMKAKEKENGRQKEKTKAEE